MKYALYLSLVFILAACNHFEVQHISNYSCDNDMKIAARYYHDKVGLSIDGLQKELYQTVSASGSKYATENGIESGTGLIWWAKGDEATMFEMVLDHTANPDDYKVIASCKETGR